MEKKIDWVPLEQGESIPTFTKPKKALPKDVIVPKKGVNKNNKKRKAQKKARRKNRR